MKIRVYTTQWCSDCRRAKRFLRENEVPFDEIDIEQDERAVQIVMEQNGGKRRVPTFEIDGAHYGNPSIPELARIVGVSI
jgi:glutaredoxin